MNERNTIAVHGCEVSDEVVRNVERHRVVLILGAVLERVQREFAEFVELELQLLKVVEVDEALGVDRLDKVVRQDECHEIRQMTERVRFNHGYLRNNHVK